MATMWRALGYATALVGAVAAVATVISRNRSFVLAHGYYFDIRLIWFVLDVALLIIGVAIVWRAA